MGFYAPAQIVRDVRDHGVEVRPVDVNHSFWDCSLEPGGDPEGPGQGMALRLGFRQVKGVPQEEAEWLVAARGNGYGDPVTLWRKAGLEPAVLAKLAKADAFASLGLDRRQALWAIKPLGDKPLPLFEAAGEEDRGAEPAVELPAMTLGDQVVEDYRALRLTLRTHPLELLRERLGETTPAEALVGIKHGTRLSTAGLVIARQRPGTAKGVIFITLEDETGVSNIVVWARVYEAHRRQVLTGRLLRITGKLEREESVVHIIAEKIEDLSPLLDGLSEAGGFEQGYAHADEVKRPVAEDNRARKTAPRPRHPREESKLLFPSRDFH
jgi:error-prone DNA polymerase